MKPITIHAPERDYALDFNRDTVQAAERRGFRISELDEMPMTMIPLLFSSAFLMHCPDVEQETIDELWDSVTNKQGLFNELAKRYANTMKTLFRENESGDKGNGVSWD